MDNYEACRYTRSMGDTTADKLTIHITGGASPEKIGAGELGTLLQALEQSVTAIAQRDDPDTSSETKFALLSIDAGSVKLAFSIPSSYSPSISLLCSRFASGDISDLPEKCRRAVMSLGKWCRDRSFTIDWLLGETWIGSISPALDFRFEAAPQLRGSAALVGTIRTVGGEKPSFRLRLSGGDLLACSCGEDLARQAGKYLYRRVSVEGFARNNMLTAEIASFEATAIALAERKLGAAFDSIRERFGSAFDAVDVDRFMSQVRGE